MVVAVSPAATRSSSSSAATPISWSTPAAPAAPPGTWQAFSARENKDAGKIVGWAHRQPWSNGKVGMIGPSYMGISQLMAAGHKPPGLKAIFPQVPGIDVYRDIVASGGQIDVGFIPLWLGLVHTTGLIPPAYAADDPSALGTLLEHLMGGGTFTLPLVLSALTGGDSAYDGPFYRERSAGSYLKDVTVPTFLVGGEYDLFQRGTPLIFERLQRNGAPVKMIIGPWDHLEGSAGAEVGRCRLRHAHRAAPAVVRPLDQGQGHRARRDRAGHLLRAGLGQVADGSGLGGSHQGRPHATALGHLDAGRQVRRTPQEAWLRGQVDDAAAAGVGPVLPVHEPVDRRHPEPDLGRQPVLQRTTTSTTTPG